MKKKKQDSNSNELEEKIKNLIEKYYPNSSWAFFILEDGKDVLRQRESDKESLEFTVGHSDDISDAVILTTLGIKCLLWKAGPGELDDIMEDVIGKLSNTDMNDMIKGYKGPNVFNSENEAVKAFKKAGSIKDYLKNRMKDKWDGKS